MTQPSLHHLDCPDMQRGHRMAWWRWGDEASAWVVVCVHGLTRQGRDFDVLAQALLARAYAAGQSLCVVCPDIAGRGRSDWLPDPMAYQISTYVADMLLLVAELRGQAPERRFDWVGTSMGGLIGLSVCGALAQQEGAGGANVFRRLVLNDVGPAIQWQALQRIASYVGAPGLQFSSVEEGAAYLRGIFGGFGQHTHAQWLALSEPMLAQVGEGRWRLHYDPTIAQAFRLLTPEIAAKAEAALWEVYDRVRVPTLLLRGAQSDLLSAEAAQTMTQRGPRARLVSFAGVGHAPTLIWADQVDAVSGFLLDD